MPSSVSLPTLPVLRINPTKKSVVICSALKTNNTHDRNPKHQGLPTLGILGKRAVNVTNATVFFALAISCINR